MSKAFPLQPDEIAAPVTFREGGRKHRVVHVFRPPQFADWMEYELKLNRSVELAGGHTRFDQERAEAAEALWSRTAVRVEGYLVSNAFTGSNGEESALSPLPEAFPDCWREKVPLLHKMAAVQLLAQVFPADEEEIEPYAFDPDHIQVHLVAARNGREYSGLVHKFRRPSARQQKKFSRVVSTALYVRGSHTEKSILPSRLREFVKFYDDLIVQAEGYCLSSASLGFSPSSEKATEAEETDQAHELTAEDCRRYMDAMHKQTAIAALVSFEEPAGSEK